ncbi:glycosyltransferase family 2 protein, partial [Dermatophilus congolensis]
MPQNVSNTDKFLTQTSNNNADEHTMTTKLLAACIVATDEATDLRACIASLQRLTPLVSEICVYSIGADPRILDQATSAGATVTTGTGEYDESLARNNAAAMTDATWVLHLTPNDRVTADIERLERLIQATPGMMAQPDLLSILLTYDEDPTEHREKLLYRPAIARFRGIHDPQLEPLIPGRKPTTLTPGRDVITINRATNTPDPATNRSRLERRRHRATTAITTLEHEGTAGDALVTALVERARLHRALGDDNAALTDLTRARATRATRICRWRARQDLASLLIAHNHHNAASAVIAELDRDGADSEYTAWLRALSSASQGKAYSALRTLRTLHNVTAADGRKVPTTTILNERMILAARIGEFDEALDCCIRLVSVHGQPQRFARMLLKLWGGRSAAGLAERLIETGGPNQTAVAAALAQLAEPGPTIAASLLEPTSEK